MRIGKGITFVGIVVLIMGIIFHLQGHSRVGPELSFMYSNPDWVTYGLEIAIVGGVIIGIGGLLFSKSV